MKPFLITGLPRSRTAWFSVLASSLPGAICYHEPIIKHADWGPVYRLWGDQTYEFVGIADPHMGFKLGPLLNAFSPQTLIIERNLGDVEQALRELTDRPSNGYCVRLKEHLDEFRAHSLVKVVRFEDLSNPEIVLSCLAHLMPGSMMDMVKLEEFMHMNIQTDMVRIWDAAKRLSPDLFRETQESASCL